MALFTGNIRFTSTDAAQDDNKGNVYYDDSESRLKHYDGSDWANVNKNINYDRPGDGQYDVDNYTSLLIHSDTSNGITTFADSSATGHAITANGSAAHSTTQAKLGASSYYNDGTSMTTPGNTLTIGDSDDWDWGTEPYTVDMWIYSTNLSSWGGFVDMNTTSDEWTFAQSDTGKIRLYDQGGPHKIESSTTLIVNTWYHVALVRVSGGNTKMYINGIHEGSVYADTTDHDYDAVYVGGFNEATYDFTGYIDELRISKGIARWTSNFTVY
jgi:hypothetical protein